MPRRCASCSASFRARWEESAATCRRLGLGWSLAQALQGLGLIALEEGRPDAAVALADDRAAAAAALGDQYVVAVADWTRAQVALARDDVAAAGRLLMAFLARFLDQDGRWASPKSCAWRRTWLAPSVTQ